jgi:hypothetical protein
VTHREDSMAVLRDAAILIGATTALLFIWGYAYESFATVSGSVPGMFRPTMPVHDRAVVGGIVAMYSIFPCVLIVWLVDQVTGWHLVNWATRIWKLGFAHRFVLIVAALALSVSAVKPIAAISERSWSRTLRLDEFSLKAGISSTLSKGMYCVGRVDGTYVFVDTLVGPQRRIVLIQEDQFDFLTLAYGPK